MEVLVRVVLADGNPLVRAGLVAVLGAVDDIRVVAAADRAHDAVQLAMQADPHVVVIDLCPDHAAGIAATREIVRAGIHARVLVLVADAAAEHLVAAMEAGAAGFLLHAAAPRQVVDAVRAIAHGVAEGVPASPAERASRLGSPVHVDTTIRNGARRTDRAGFEKLTERERDVLALFAAGYSAPEIGEKLDISPKTVDTYKQRIHGKIGLSHRAEYVQLALRLGLLHR